MRYEHRPPGVEKHQEFSLYVVREKEDKKKEEKRRDMTKHSKNNNNNKIVRGKCGL